LALTLYRAYDAPSATWVSEDPLVRHAALLSRLDFGAWSGYAYANANPISGRDPLGLQGPEAAAVIVICSNPAAAAAALLFAGVVAVATCKPCREQLTRKFRCDEQLDEDEQRCRSFTNKRLRALCWANAMDRYSDCLAGRPRQGLGTPFTDVVHTMELIDIGDLIAERRFHLLDRPGFQVSLLIGRPRPVAGGDDWCCPYQIVGVGDEVVRAAMGVDALQSLQLVITKAVPAWLTKTLAENPGLRWEDAEPGDLGL
jgi:RHS repeat-associated protein